MLCRGIYLVKARRYVGVVFYQSGVDPWVGVQLVLPMPY